MTKRKKTKEGKKKRKRVQPPLGDKITLKVNRIKRKLQRKFSFLILTTKKEHLLRMVLFLLFVSLFAYYMASTLNTQFHDDYQPIILNNASGYEKINIEYTNSNLYLSLKGVKGESLSVTIGADANPYLRVNGENMSESCSKTKSTTRRQWKCGVKIDDGTDVEIVAPIIDFSGRYFITTNPDHKVEKWSFVFDKGRKYGCKGDCISILSVGEVRSIQNISSYFRDNKVHVVPQPHNWNTYLHLDFVTNTYHRQKKI